MPSLGHTYIGASRAEDCLQGLGQMPFPWAEWVSFPRHYHSTSPQHTTPKGLEPGPVEMYLSHRHGFSTFEENNVSDKTSKMQKWGISMREMKAFKKRKMVHGWFGCSLLLLLLLISMFHFYSIPKSHWTAVLKLERSWEIIFSSLFCLQRRKLRSRNLLNSSLPGA